MTNLRALLVIAALLSGCTDLRTLSHNKLIGLHRDSIISCLGVPDAKELGVNHEVLEWKQDSAVQAPLEITTPFSAGISIGGKGTCHVVVTITKDLVSNLAFTGPSATLEGPNAACKPILRACLLSDPSIR